MSDERDANLTDVVVVYPMTTITAMSSASTMTFPTTCGTVTATYTPTYAPSTWDYHAISANFNNMAVAINALNHEVRAMKKFFWWVSDTHPEVIEKYVVSNQVIQRMERKQ